MLSPTGSASGGGAAAAAVATAAPSGKSAAATATASAAAQAREDAEIIVDPVVAALWGVLPIVARLFPGDIKAGAAPTDKHLLVPRQGFLLHHMDGLRAHFSPFAENIHSLWLSVRDERSGMHAYVPWYLPTHVIADRVMSRQDQLDPQSWGKNFLPLVVFVHFTLPPAVKKKQRPDLASQPEVLLPVKDSPGIATLHMYRWVKEVHLTRFGDLVGFEGESREVGVRRALGLRILKAARDNDPSSMAGVRRDLQRRAAAQTHANLCVVVHCFDATLEKPLWRFKALRVRAEGRSFGRVLGEIIPALELVSPSVLSADDRLPPQYGAVFVQGVQPMMSTPFDVLAEVFQSADLALHIVWRPPLK
jgi:hypothetical protein